jgi:hypothetical protein
MPVGQTTAQVGRPAYVALAATGVAAQTVILKSFLDLGPGLNTGSLLYKGIVAAQAGVQAVRIVQSYIVVTLAALLNGVRLSLYARVSLVFFLGLAVTAMAVNAALLTVN